MTEYQFHWLASKASHAPLPKVSFQAESHLHGAALALRHFQQLGCDVAAPLAHIDVTEGNGAKQTILVEEVLDWLSDPKQADFIHREGLVELLAGRD